MLLLSESQIQYSEKGGKYINNNNSNSKNFYSALYNNKITLRRFTYIHDKNILS